LNFLVVSTLFHHEIEKKVILPINQNDQQTEEDEEEKENKPFEIAATITSHHIPPKNNMND